MRKDEAVAGTEPPKLGFRFAMHLCAVCLSLRGLASAMPRLGTSQSKYPRACDLTLTAPQI